MSHRFRIPLNRVSLKYDDPALERAYMQGYHATVARSLKPILLALLPFTLIVSLIEYLEIYETPVSALSAALLFLCIALLYALTWISPRLVQYGVVATFGAFNVVLLSLVDNDATLQVFMPALMMVFLLTQCVGLGFLLGIIATVVLYAATLIYLGFAGFEIQLFLDASVFLFAGYTIVASAGYTIERQRRLLFGQVRAIEQERAAHEQASLHDSLTGLPNRKLLYDQMTQSVARARRHHGRFAVFFVDLDDFKQVNDNHGHAVGDEVLQAISRQLQSSVRTEDTLARLGGDEFVVLSDAVESEDEAKATAERLRQAVSKPITVKHGHQAQALSVGASIGFSLWQDDADTLESLIQAADKKMYEVKQQKGS